MTKLQQKFFDLLLDSGLFYHVDKIENCFFISKEHFQAFTEFNFIDQNEFTKGNDFLWFVDNEFFGFDDEPLKITDNYYQEKAVNLCCFDDDTHIRKSDKPYIFVCSE